MSRRKGPTKRELAALAKVPGARVLAVNPDALRADGAAEDDARPAGTVICEGTVPGRAIPWKSPKVSRSGGVIPTRGYRAYKDWQATVAQHAALAMGRRRPYGGPVDVHLTFYLRPDGRTKPDRTNAAKSTEDALQGIVYVNDTQIVGGDVRLVMTSREPQRVEFRVVAVDGAA